MAAACDPAGGSIPSGACCEPSPEPSLIVSYGGGYSLIACISGDSPEFPAKRLEVSGETPESTADRQKKIRRNAAPVPTFRRGASAFRLPGQAFRQMARPFLGGSLGADWHATGGLSWRIAGFPGETPETSRRNAVKIKAKRPEIRRNALKSGARPEGRRIALLSMKNSRAVS